MLYSGSCHCGNIAFEVEGELTTVIDCNCLLCRRRGALHWFVPRSRLRLLTPEPALATYTFTPHTIQHHFCAKCGCAPLGEGTNPKGGKMAAVNVRCLEDVDLSALRIQPFDGKNL